MARAASQQVVTIGPVPVTLSGSVKGTDGKSTKMAPVALQYAEITDITTGATTNKSTFQILASSIPTTNAVSILGSNTVTVLNFTNSVPTYFSTDNDTAVTITKGTSAEAIDVFYDDSASHSAGNSNAVLFVDAKLKADKKTGTLSEGSAKVSGLWVAGKEVIKGTLKATK